jgi:sterol desaturase/sphingolipid hydroxylase (fatty acid hydroxylase superfamily)
MRTGAPPTVFPSGSRSSRTGGASRDRNFGLPAIDKIFGTACMPKGKRPAGVGIHDPVPQVGYLRHLAYPFTKPPRAGVVA